MPLVPESTYHAWFRKSSWVYRAFAYLFVNPLWQKRVPAGFSLCPLFWSAIFSLTVFRPFVYLVLGLRLIARVLRLSKALGFVDALVCRVAQYDPSRTVPGIPTMLALIIGGWLGMLLYVVGSGLILAAVEGELLTCLLAWPNVIVFLACAIYHSEHRHDPDRCRVEWYVRASLVLSLLLLIVFHPAATATAFIGYPIAAAGWFLSALWTVLTAIVTGVWWIITWLVASVLAGSIYAIGAVAFILLCGLFGWIAAWVYPLGLGVGAQDGPPLLTKAQVKANVERIVEYAFINTRSGSQFYHSNIRLCVRLMPEVMALAESKPELTDEDIAPLLQSIIAFIERRHLEQQERETKRSATCKRFTGAVALVFKPVTIVWKQVRIGLSYAWALAKALKAKNCPYLRFED